MLQGQGDLIRRLNAAKGGRPLLRTIQRRAVAEAKKRHKPNRKTGHTSSTILPGGLTDRYTIVTASGAAVFLEFGTRPHIIRPRDKPMLAWPANASGRRLSGRARTKGGRKVGPFIRAKVVHHPGTKPQPFLLPGAIAAVESVGISTLVKAWNDAA